MPDEAATVFGARLPLALRYADLLVDQGVRRGLIGPREPQRIWSRHLLNCAAVSGAVPDRATVVDVGSGAGLPGLVLAIRRPDLTVRLIDAQERRTTFLCAAVDELGLGAQVQVVRGRAEDPAIIALAGAAGLVTARAVAPLDRLVGWCMPLLAPGGRLALIRGTAAGAELDEHAAAIRRAGGRSPRLVHYRVGSADVAVVLVESSTDRGRKGRDERGR